MGGERFDVSPRFHRSPLSHDLKVFHLALNVNDLALNVCAPPRVNSYVLVVPGHSFGDPVTLCRLPSVLPRRAPPVSPERKGSDPPVPGARTQRTAAWLERGEAKRGEAPQRAMYCWHLKIEFREDIYIYIYNACVYTGNP